MRWLAKRTLALLIGAFVLTALLAYGAPSQGSESFDPDSFREYDVGDGSVTMDVKNAPLGQVVADRIQPHTRVNIFVAPEAAEKLVTLKVVNLHWVRTLDALVERVGGSIIRVGANLLRIERPVPISIVFEDEDVRTVILTLMAYRSGSLEPLPAGEDEPLPAGEEAYEDAAELYPAAPEGRPFYGMVLGADLHGRITMSVDNAPWRPVLELVAAAVGAVVEETFPGLLWVHMPKPDVRMRVYDLEDFEVGGLSRIREQLPKVELAVQGNQVIARGTNADHGRIAEALLEPSGQASEPAPTTGPAGS